MSMSEYELSLVMEAKKGKKKSFDRLYDALHKELCYVVELELGDRSRAETILRAAFEKLRDQIKLVDDPASFEELAIKATAEECRFYPAAAAPAESGASQFEVIETAANKTPQKKPAPQPVQQPIRRPAPQPAPQPVQQPIRRPAPQPAPRPVQPVQQPIQRPAPQPAPRPVQPVQKPVQPPIRRPVTPPAPQPQPEPVMGWLVCINGADRGTRFAIRNKTNTIGSGARSDIRITNEPTVSPDNHASIAYDSARRACVIRPGAGKTVNFNGQAISYPMVLKQFDILTFGDAQFVYAPVEAGLGWLSDFGL